MSQCFLETPNTLTVEREVSALQNRERDYPIGELLRIACEF